MRYSWGALVVFLFGVLTTIALGCQQVEEATSVTLADLPSHVGERVWVTGCLVFSCPTFFGAVYPRDCKVLLREGDFAVALEFPDALEALRETLNGYYEEHFSTCVRLKVLGTVRVTSCDGAGCEPTIFIEVEDIRVLE
ncbi:MAG: hypothetical protein PWP60_447 [Candidatus Atribacteria bacterium]|nr:hypothetical protein [Candidatus Atribacteria bacterium]